MTKNTKIVLALIIIIVLVIVAVELWPKGGLGSIPSQVASNQSASTGKVLQVVAAENFWGSIVAQIGGIHVQVLSIVSDPNADPHEYESNASDARAVATADYVIENGAGYDSWMDKLISAGTVSASGSGNGFAAAGSSNSSSSRVVLNVATLLGKKDGDNPHFWYNPDYVNQVAKQMETNLIALDPSDTTYFQQQYSTLQTNLAEYQNRILAIKKQFGGVPANGMTNDITTIDSTTTGLSNTSSRQATTTEVAATENIFVYLANAAGLDLISPPAFIEAVAEGNDPPAPSVQFEQQLKSGQVKILVYNEQTVTPITETMKKIAADEGIPVVGITETIQPPDATFQEWMNAELLDIQNALNANELGK
jgi:zinc/manganese transport system substrate-binding protein